MLHSKPLTCVPHIITQVMQDPGLKFEQNTIAVFLTLGLKSSPESFFRSDV